MTQVSKHPLSQPIAKRVSQLFASTIKNLDKAEDIHEFIHDLLSPVERIMLAKRLAIAVLLSKNYSYSDIMKILKVSPPTIAQVGVSLKYSGTGYKRVVKKILDDEKIEQLFEQIDDFLDDLLPPYGRNLRAWRSEKALTKRQNRKPF